MQDAIRWLQAAVVRVSAASVLSLNEEVDDIPTADLKYLLLPYMQGYLLSDSRERDAHKRLEVMQEAGSHLTRCACCNSRHRRREPCVSSSLY